jgi:hypothetical protein
MFKCRNKHALLEVDYCWKRLWFVWLNIVKHVNSIITGFVTRVTRRVPLVEQELLTLLRYLISTRDFGGVRGSRSLIFCLVFCRSLCVLLSFFPSCCLFFDLHILITLWYLQALLMLNLIWVFKVIFKIISFTSSILLVKEYRRIQGNCRFLINSWSTLSQKAVSLARQWRELNCQNSEAITVG